MHYVVQKQTPLTLPAPHREEYTSCCACCFRVPVERVAYVRPSLGPSFKTVGPSTPGSFVSEANSALHGINSQIPIREQRCWGNVVHRLHARPFHAFAIAFGLAIKPSSNLICRVPKPCVNPSGPHADSLSP